MKPWLKLCALGAKTCATGAASFVLWTIWLGLAVLLVIQGYVATSHELAVPPFLLRRLEERLAESGLRVTFGRTSFDPKGHLLVEDLRFYLPAFPEPVATARAVFLRLNPRPLITGGLEPVEIQIMHATVAAPAQLTPSGRTEELLGSIEVTLEPRRHDWLIRQLHARCANLTLSIGGAFTLPTSAAQPAGPPFRETVARQFPVVCRQLLSLQEKLAAVDEPSLRLELVPAPSGLPAVDVHVLARKVTIRGAVAAEADDLVATTRLQLQRTVSLGPVDLSARQLRLPRGATAQGLTAQLTGNVRTDPPGFDPGEAVITLDALTVEGVEARALSARVNPQPLPRIETAITTRVLDAPLALRASADLTAGTAGVRFDGEISPRVLDVVSKYVGVDVRRYYSFEALEAADGRARFGAGWKFEQLTARVRVPRMNSYGVIMEDGRATVELQPGRFYSPEAFARVGENYASGSYEHNLRTHEYRFLLTGRLRPLAISPWFGAWWPNFFNQLGFPGAPPEASVDVNGTWKQGRRSVVLLSAETPKVVFRGTELDRTRTRLFIRPGFFDSPELITQRDDGEVRGAFTYRLNADNEWQSFEFTADSTFELPAITQLLGPTISKSIAPFRVVLAPTVKVQGSFQGPAAVEKHEDTLDLDVRTDGEFRFHDFPLEDVSFSAKLRGSEVIIDRFHGSFSGGSVAGNARVWGRDDARRIGFDVSIEDANLGQAVTTLQGFLAAQKGQPPPPPGKFVQERANLHLNIAASAEGSYSSPFTYRGDGNAILRGAEIGEVPLLGLLSGLFTFTSLRFTEARANFKIDGPKLIFPKIELRGANSAIDGHGDFTLDRHELNFTAKVFPFQESGNVLKSVVGAVLTPLSNVLEVKLSGNLEDPQWAFVMGPRNFLRALTEGGGESPKPAEPATPNPPPGAETPKP